MIPAADQNRVLVFVEFIIWARIGRVVILEIVAGMIILILHQQQRGVMWSDLLLDRRIPFDVIKAIVRTNAVIMMIVQIKRIRGIAESAKLGGLFMIHPIRAHVG